MSTETVKVDNKGVMTLAEDILARVEIRNQRMNAFAVGEHLKVIYIGDKADRKGKVQPHFNLGDGKEVSLDVLANFFVDSPELQKAIVNKGEDEECFERGYQGMTLLQYIRDNGNKLPGELSVSARVKQGAGKEYVEEKEKGAVRKAGYEALGLDCSKDNFPFAWLREGADPEKKENWVLFDKIVVSAG
jgi:hypothetical protein